MDKFDLITQNLEEVLTPEELKILIDNKEKLVHYIGFEISGLVHLGSGLLSCMKIKDFQEAGVQTKIFLADWHAWINEKLDGKLETIKKIGVGYFKEAFIAILEAIGANPKKTEFILGSDLYHNADKYWLTVVEVAKNTTLARTQRSIDILGKKLGEGTDFAKLMYPIMQASDIFFMDVNLAHAGMDQRKAHVIAKNVANNLSFKPLLNKNKQKIKPVALHQHLLLGLGKPPRDPKELSKEELQDLRAEMKMSKSKPDTCIFVHDSPSEIERKIMKAYCPPPLLSSGQATDIEYNPVVDWTINLILPLKNNINIKIQSGAKNYKNKESLINDYQNEIIHPMDLKEAVIKELQQILNPIYKHFQSGRPQKLLGELMHIKA